MKDFPGGPVVKNLPCNAGDVGSIPGQGTEIPYATEQLSLYGHIFTSLGYIPRSGIARSYVTLSRLPRWRLCKESACQCRRHKRCRFDPWVGKIPWRRKWQPTPVFLPGKSLERGAWWASP